MREKFDGAALGGGETHCATALATSRLCGLPPRAAGELARSLPLTPQVLNKGCYLYTSPTSGSTTGNSQYTGVFRGLRELNGKTGT